MDIRETEEELKALLRKEKDATRHKKLQVLYWLKSQAVDSVLSATVRRRETSYYRSRDGCLAIEGGESKNYYPRKLVQEDPE
jgi:hypothetical protein